MRRLALLVMAALSPSCLADWTPPENPDPSRILQEASIDVDEGADADALAKLIWYHQNAMDIEPDLPTPHLHFAHSSWIKLAKRYPPANQALIVALAEAAISARKTASKHWALYKQGVADLEIPRRNGVYQYGKPQVLTSQEAVDRFIDRLRGQESAWGHDLKPGYERSHAKLRATFEKAEIDFGQEAVVVLFKTYGSGSIRAVLSEPVVEDDSLIFSIHETRPSILTMDMAYRAWAIRVPHDLATYVEVLPVRRGAAIRFVLATGQPATTDGKNHTGDKAARSERP